MSVHICAACDGAGVTLEGDDVILCGACRGGRVTVDHYIITRSWTGERMAWHFRPAVAP